MDPTKQTQSVVHLSGTSAAPMFPKINVNKSSGWVNFGAKNLFPQDIIQANSRSAVNNAIIRSVVTYICGKGVKDTAKTVGQYVGRPNVYEQWDNVIKPLARDFKQFGGFYGQVIVNKDSKTVSIFHQDFSTVRVGKIDSKGKPETFRVAYDWTKTNGNNKPIELPVWPGIDAAEKETAYMFYYWEYEPGLRMYCVPDWFAAIEYVKADGQLGEFYNNSIANGFTPSVVMEMPENPTDEKKAQFQADMEAVFTGAPGASAVLILWGNGSTGDTRPKVTPFNASANADIYNNIEGIIFQKIISAHRLSSPTLAGVSGSGNLSGNAAEIIDAYVLFNFTVVNQMRTTILDVLNQFQRINGLKDLTIEELDVLPKIMETSNPEQISAPSDTSANSLAAEIGVGGTQALTAIIENPNLPANQKRELVATLFGLDDDTLDKLFATKPATLQRVSRTAKWFKKMLSKSA